MRVLLAALLSIMLSCTTTSKAAVISIPDAPDAPKINRPEKMAPEDKRALADFYRRYAVYKEKIGAWKKRYK